MTVHLIKLCVGAASIEDLDQWQSARLDDARRRNEPQRIRHTTFQTPKRREELLDGGSLYWVIKGQIQVRQRIIGLEAGHKEDGSACCQIVLDRVLVPVRPGRRRPFQGWRYLDAADAPPDLGGGGEARSLGEMSAKMRRELSELGLL